MGKTLDTDWDILIYLFENNVDWLKKNSIYYKKNTIKPVTEMLL